MTINISTLPIKTSRNPTNCQIMSPINSRNVRRGMCGHAKLPTKFQIKKPSKRPTRSSIKRPSKCPTMSPSKASSKSLTRGPNKPKLNQETKQESNSHQDTSKAHQGHIKSAPSAHQDCNKSYRLERCAEGIPIADHQTRHF